MNEKDGINGIWLAIVTIGGIFGVLNIFKWFSKPEKTAIEEYEEIIAEKDLIIESLERKIKQYQRLLDHDTD